MPQVAIGAIASGIAGGLTFSGAFSVGFLQSFASSLVLGGLSSLITPKPKKAASSYSDIKTSGTTQQFRQAVTERTIVYGECRVSGPIVYVGSTENNTYLHMVIALASHECAAIDELIIGDESVPLDYLDASGNVLTGKYAGLIRVKKHLGATSQTADSDLVSEVSEWTENHRLRGIAYIYVRLKWDRDAFPSSIPNISAWVRGKYVYDIRDIAPGDTRVTEAGDTRLTEDEYYRETEADSSSAPKSWTPNIALCTLDYAIDDDLGIGVDINDVDDDEADAAANLCDEIVATKNIIVNALSADPATDIITLEGDVLQYFRGDRVSLATSTIGGITAGPPYYVIPYQRQGTPRIKLAASLEDAISGTAVNVTSGGTGTVIKDGEPRYHGGGVIKSTATYKSNIEELLSGMGGFLVYSGGRWYLSGLEYKSPSVYLGESETISQIKTTTKNSRRDRFNQVQGVYTSQINQGNPSDYPMVTSQTYIDLDGQAIKKTLDLPFTQRSNTAQRIAKVYLERQRQEIKFSCGFNLKALNLKAGDNFYYTSERKGWDEKVFEVVQWSLDVSEGAPVVNITAQENASAVYDFTSADDEQTVDPAPNSTLPDPFNVSVVLGFSLTSVPVNTESGDRTFKIRASWVAPDNQFVANDGQFEIQFKPSSESSWVKYPLIRGDATDSDIFQAGLGTLYDVRIRAINNLGVTSAFTTIIGFSIGSSSISTTEDWEFVTEARTGDDWETDTLTTEDWE